MRCLQNFLPGLCLSAFAIIQALFCVRERILSGKSQHVIICCGLMYDSMDVRIEVLLVDLK